MTMPRHHSACRFIALALAVFLSLTVAGFAGAMPPFASSAGDGVYLIQPEDALLATYKRTVDGLTATSPRTTGMCKPDTRKASAATPDDIDTIPVGLVAQ